MEIRRYQWVGLLAGVPLFSGAWLSAFYNTPWWGVFGLIVTAWGLYLANQVERRTTNQKQAERGIVAGLLAALSARLLGYIATLITGMAGTVSWNEIGDMFRAVLAGNWLAVLMLAFVMAGIGLIMAVLEPDAAQGRKG
jgi:hypothetical protein